jgi:hypothetical protein
MDQKTVEENIGNEVTIYGFGDLAMTHKKWIGKTCKMD